MEFYRGFYPEFGYLLENIIFIYSYKIYSLPGNDIPDDIVLVLTLIGHFPFVGDCWETGILSLCAPTSIRLNKFY